MKICLVEFVSEILQRKSCYSKHNNISCLFYLKGRNCMRKKKVCGTNKYSIDP